METKRGLLDALSVVMIAELKTNYAALTERVSAALNRLIEHGVAAGKIRESIATEYMLQTMYALYSAHESGPNWRKQVLHLLDIFNDGIKR